MSNKCVLLLVALVCLAAPAFSEDPIPVIDLPKSTMFPGARNPAITASNLTENICKQGWSTKSIRPPASYTTALKKQQLQNIGYTVRNTLPRMQTKSGNTTRPDITKCVERSSNPAWYEEDHLISLEIGGNPRDPDNLWPQPWFGTWNARVKDKLENTLHRKVCGGEITLAEAQQSIAKDWIAAYQKYVGQEP